MSIPALSFLAAAVMWLTAGASGVPTAARQAVTPSPGPQWRHSLVYDERLRRTVLLGADARDSGDLDLGRTMVASDAAVDGVQKIGRLRASANVRPLADWRDDRQHARGADGASGFEWHLRGDRDSRTRPPTGIIALRRTGSLRSGLG